MKKYIIFDFDGTLANTNDIIVASWQATYEHYLGHTLPVREIEASFGEILVNTIGRMIPDAPEIQRSGLEALQRAVPQGWAALGAPQEYEVYVFEGVRELLEQLRARGCIIGVGTSRTAYSFRNYMKKLEMDQLVDEVVTMNDVSSHKPDPETIDALLKKMMANAGEPYDECSGIPEHVRDAAVMIGDTKYDIGCANNAGVDSVIVGWSHYVDEEAMLAEGFVPTYRIDTPEQLLEMI